MMPVTTSIRRYGSFCWRKNIVTPTAAVAARPIATPSNSRRAGLELERLQEQDNLEALAVDAREAEQNECDGLASEEAAFRGARERTLALIVSLADPLRPIHPVEEPVHDHEQDADRDEARDRQKFIRIGRKLGEDRLRKEPGGDRGDERDDRSANYRLS